MGHFLLIYDTAPDYLERRAEFRDQHLALAWAAAERGELILGGAMGNPAGPDGAALLFKVPGPHVVEEFARNDPYVKNRLVKGWTVREWTTVVGTDAITPVRPE